MASYKMKNQRKAGEWGIGMRILRLALVFAGMSSVASTAFEVNVPTSELLQRTDRLTVMDLAVGEIGIVTLPSYCIEGSKLFAHGILPLAEKSSRLLGPNTRFKRMPGGLFEVTIEKPEDSDKPLTYWLANTGLSAVMSPCSQVTGLPYKVEITTINGAMNLSDLLP